MSTLAGDRQDHSVSSVRHPSPLQRFRTTHLLVAAIALAAAAYVTSGLLLDPYGYTLSENIGDQALFEWTLAYGVEILRHGANPYFTTLMNSPDGVNLAANTSVTTYAILLAPVTWLAGAQVSFVVALTLNLAGTAFAWYLFLQRWLVTSRFAAAVAGLFGGLAPGFISHANSHLNFTAGWIAPVLIWRVLRLREHGRRLREGAVLGVLVAACFSIAAESLFQVALACGIFVAAWSCSRATWPQARAQATTMLAGLAVAGTIAGLLLAYPIAMFLAGPQSFAGTGYNRQKFSEDLVSYAGYSSHSLAASFGLSNADLSANPTEETSYLGAPMIILLLVAIVVLLRESEPGRRATLRGLAVTGSWFLLISLGPHLKLNGTVTGVALPYDLLQHLPLFDSALPARYALTVVGVFTILLSLAAERFLTRPIAWTRARMPLQAGLVLAFVVALVPLAPSPLPVSRRSHEPAFLADGLWRDYVSPGGALSTLPIASGNTSDGQRWQAYTMARGRSAYRMPGGIFLGPGGKDGAGRPGAVPRYTDQLFHAAVNGDIRPITNDDRAQARADFAFWKIDAVFVTDESTTGEVLPSRQALEVELATSLLGLPQRVGGVRLWVIRRGIDPIAR